MSSEYSRVRTKKLSFKGETSNSTGKRKVVSNPSSSAVDAESQGVPGRKWTLVDALTDLEGPLYLLHSSGHHLTTDDATHRLLCPKAPSSSETESEEQGLSPLSEPTDVLHVWVGRRLDAAGTMSLRASTGMYLSSDKVGVVRVDKEAVGPLESWTPVIRDEGVAFQNAYGRYLTYDETGGGIRGDAESIGLREIWRLQCQTQRKHDAAKDRASSKKDDRSVVDVELEAIKKNQTWGGGRVRRFEADDIRELKKAKKQGRLNEALLDRRAKVKSDKFC
ncbi:FRG1-like family-domain-containing protein [Piptocephalis cylindrospora]|uniref:FRG1-like family-domain-containing protein n=1 Tax=Piptocephalis cylindrospora TaxID=1907219 RepID=A0A4P9Y9Q5_9FUNG|nr:FRG1-like family-domain-containing protein [Piptocephalis cylindrospora]|eukprot:RKP15171.1 FRG1-like family-domain-containing protein [Piptocephalis cylindrospora]